jgi:excisionase family DNA binding protein
VSVPRLPRRWVSLADAAEYTGLSQKTIRAHIAAGHLPAYRPRGSRVIRIDLRELDRWVTGDGPVVPATWNEDYGRSASWPTWGVCPVCGLTHAVHRNGRLRRHGTGGEVCPGTGQQPGQPWRGP